MTTMAPAARSTDSAAGVSKRYLADCRRRSREVCPIPAEGLALLSASLAKMTPKVSLAGWDECPPAYVGPPPGEGVEGAWFDVAAVVRAVRALCALRHTKGRWAGRPLVPDGWQVVWIVAPVFGWRYSVSDADEDRRGARIVRELYVEIPRKNGKSTLSSGLALILLAADGEAGGEVYAAASSTGQARIVFDEAKRMASASPELARKTQRLRDVIRHPKSGSFFRVLSSVADTSHGLNVHGAIIDELHVHKSRDLVDIIETGTGSRLQPLTATITTADEGKEGTIYDEKHNRARQCAHRVYRLPHYFGVIWCAPDDADPFAEQTQRAANPGYGRSVSPSYLRAQADKARTSPSFHPAYCRLHLNLRRRQQARFLRLEDWDQPANAEPFTLDEVAGAMAWGGLDLSATRDLTAFQLVIPDEAGRRLRVLSRLWLPEDGLADRIKRDQVPYDEWAEQGYLTLTEGNVVDYDAVVDEVLALSKVLDLQGIRHDRWQAAAVVNRLTSAGIDVSPVSQNYAGMSEPSKMLERLVLQGRLQHGGHPVLRWMADAVEAERSKSNPDLVRPVKPNRLKTSKRVDGIVATIMAVDAWMRRPPPPAPPASAPPIDNTEDMFRPSERLDL